ncbi:MAG: hypothetical protein M1365_08765 [Actinobacteria bacterium]|nr:hypothetical protein [Actinomycetota bacterium]
MAGNLFPKTISIKGKKAFDLRYGENPHQKAALYITDSYSPFTNLKLLAGRESSLVNITDINAGLEVVKIFKEAAAVVIKHNTPCGIALGQTPQEALERAIESDSESAFGGIIVLNKKLDLKAAKVVENFKKAGKGNMDIVAAPSLDPKAVKLLKEIRKSMAIYTFGPIINKAKDNFKWIDGGFIIQTADDAGDTNRKNWTIPTRAKPTKEQLKQMEIGWKFVSRVKSNTIIIMDKNLPMTRGIGQGQTSRFRSTKLALESAGKFCKGGIMVSDSFFPFGDAIKEAKRYKIAAIIQQGDSVNDKASIDQADKAGIPMVFTHKRAFWH